MPLTMKVFFHPDFLEVYTSDPAAVAGRLESVLAVIQGRVELVEPQPASLEDLTAVHTPEHLAWVQNRGLHQVAALAAGASTAAAQAGLAEPCLALVRPPGHHASSGSAWGFCYYNNMAVALTSLKNRQLIQTACVLDIDMHFGDGTANILEQQGWAWVHNPEADSRPDYLQEVESCLDRQRADIIGVSAGFDNHAQDWGGLLQTKDYARIGRLVARAARDQQAGCFAVLEGGYNHRVLGNNVLALLEGMGA